MDGRVDTLQLLRRIVGRIVVGVFPDGPDHGERRVEDQRGIVRTDDVLVGGTDLDGTVVPQTATHTCPAEVGGHQQRQGLADVVASPGLRLTAWLKVTDVEEADKQDEQHHQIPVLDELVAHDAAQFIVAAKLAEEGDGGAAGREFEVDGVAQVHSQCQTVDDQVEPLAGLLPPAALLLMEGQENQQDIEGVGIGDGGGVEQQASPHDAPDLVGTGDVAVEAAVLQIEGHPCHSVGYVEQGDVPQQGNGACRTFILKQSDHLFTSLVVVGLVSSALYTVG